MLSDKQHILQLVALLAAHGVSHVVVCPGSRNAPIVHTLSACGRFTLHAVTDERSAGFCAMGIALATHQPTVVCVTSGSALLNLHPAMAEAFYQHIPLVVISADRPASWIGQMDGQTLPQPYVFGTLSACNVQLPEGEDSESLWYANRLINEALLHATRGEGHPVHINIPLSEPLYEFHSTQLPSVRVIHRLEEKGEMTQWVKRSHNRWLLLGQLHTPLPEDLLVCLSKHFHIFAEHLSGCTAYPFVTTLTDLTINQFDNDTLRPDFVISMGGHLVCKELKKLLRQHHPTVHWQVNADGDIADTYCSLTHIIQAEPTSFLSLLKECVADIPEQLPTATPVAPTPRATPSLQAMQLLSESLHAHTCQHIFLHLANSTTVRNAQLVQLPNHVSVRCNRGVNGIEGSLSTAVGHAMATPDSLNVMVIGDLSFFYDNNALWQASLPSNLRILLINNGGGEIFSTLPVPAEPESRQCICGTDCQEATHLCAHYHLAHHAATSLQELHSLLPLLFLSQEPMLIEFTDKKPENAG